MLEACGWHARVQEGQVAWGGTDYGVTSVVVGTRARLPYRVFTLHDGSTTRLVVDIAHRW